MLFLTLLCLCASVAPAQAAFPGGNGKIAYYTYAPGTGYQVESIESDGTGNSVHFSGVDPAWSADGQRLAFTRGNIHTARPDGSELFQVTHDTCDFSCTSSVGANFSPDGTRIAMATSYCAPRVGCFDEVAWVNDDGSGRVVFAFDANDPAWSPDGEHIAFDSSYYGISILRLSDGEYSYLTNNAYDSHPSWSPDGTRIVFSRFVAARGSAEIYTMNADGTNEVRLTDNYTFDYDPAWSPDGSKIVYANVGEGSGDTTQVDLHAMRPDGTGDVNITNTPSVSEYSPDWQPLLGPRRGDYKNAAQFCKALRDFMGNDAFSNRYGGGANAHGKCVSSDRR